MGQRRHPSRFECLRTLGLGPGASWRQIKVAYRRLALRYHPDRHRAAAGDPLAAECGWMFRRIAWAYAVLERSRIEQTAGAGAFCDRCGDLEPLREGLDGNRYCAACLTYAAGKRALPSAPPVVVRHGSAAIGMLASAALLVAWVLTGWLPYWWMALFSCTTALAVLAATCITVQYATSTPKHRITSGGWRSWLRRLARA